MARAQECRGPWLFERRVSGTVPAGWVLAISYLVSKRNIFSDARLFAEITKEGERALHDHRSEVFAIDLHGVFKQR